MINSFKEKNGNSFSFKISMCYKLAALWFSVVAVAPNSVDAFNKQLWTGMDVGYGGTYASRNTFPSIFDSFSLGLHALYGINSYVGVSWEGAIDLHPKYMIWKQVEVAEGTSKTSLGWAEGPIVEKFFLSSTAISFVYAIDVLRFVPFLSLGLLGSRVDKTVDGDHEHGYDAGLRINVGFNYIFKKKVGLGALFVYDQHFWRQSNIKRRMILLIRLSKVFDFNKENDKKTGKGR